MEAGHVVARIVAGRGACWVVDSAPFRFLVARLQSVAIVLEGMRWIVRIGSCYTHCDFLLPNLKPKNETIFSWVSRRWDGFFFVCLIGRGISKQTLID